MSIMQDRRYPNLRWVGVDGLGQGGPPLDMPHDAERVARALAIRVCGACPGIRAGYDTVRKSIGFYYRSPVDSTTAGVLSLSLVRSDGTVANLLADVDRIIWNINLGKVPAKVKDAWERQHEESRKSALREESRRELSDQRSDAVDYLKRRKGKRKTIGVKQ